MRMMRERSDSEVIEIVNKVPVSQRSILKKAALNTERSHKKVTLNIEPQAQGGYQHSQKDAFPLSARSTGSNSRLINSFKQKNIDIGTFMLFHQVPKPGKGQ